MKPERRTLQEQIGIAVNASTLVSRGRSPNVETPLQQVAALGAAALHVHHGADRRLPGHPDLAVAYVVAEAGHQPDPRNVLAADLGQLLRHLHDGGRLELILLSASRLAEWMGYSTRFAAMSDRRQLLPRLALRALDEWLSNRCPRCGGTGRLEILQDGRLVRGQGRHQRNARFRHCPVHDGCGGTGKARPSPPARCRALGIDRGRYDAERWGAHFNAALAWLDQLCRRLHRPLTRQLERSKKRV